jgi:outer membrane protein OmpA-like peptidoglycan-associated protein
MRPRLSRVHDLVFFGILLAPAAMPQSLPSELPLPSGASVTRVERANFGQDEFNYPNANRATEHAKIDGHVWRAFLKGDATSLGVPAWKSTLEAAGWQMLNPTPGNTIARKGDWWAKIGLDRLVLIQHVEAEPIALAPPGETVEELKANQDLPYLAPIPNTTRKIWKAEDPFELKGTKDAEPRMLGPAVFLRYEGEASLSPVEIQARYSLSFQKAGWDVVRNDSGGLVGAHYTQHGRDVWAKITPIGSAYTLEVADLGAAAAQDKLAKALKDEGHIALYGIYFDSDQATLRPDSEATLVQIQKLLTSQAALQLEIQGHTDNTGTRPHNDMLSEQRAAAVKAWLVSHGIAAARLTAKGYADTKPVANNATPQGRALNRRVELARP